MVRGAFHDIEYAARGDMSLPAEDFLRALKAGMWAPDPDAESLPSDAQISDYHKFLDACRHIARNGVPAYTRQVNDLEDGVWEFKHGAKRLSWYDTDGAGNYVPKLRISDPAKSNYPDDPFWWFPEFDQQLRLGHAFPKVGIAAELFDIAETLAVREEDLEHDRSG